MAALSEADRAEIWAEFMRDQLALVVEVGDGDLTKQDLRALFDDIDDWLDGNKASANSAIRQPLRNNASSAIKFFVLAAVAQRRAIRRS